MVWAKAVISKKGISFPTATKRTIFHMIPMKTEGLKCRVCGSILPHGVKGEVYASISRYKAYELPQRGRHLLGWSVPPVIPRLNEVRCRVDFEDRYCDSCDSTES